MTTLTALAQNPRFKIGWTILVGIAALMTLNHFVLIFFMNEAELFIGYAAFNLYALIVILIPFRRLEKWAWLSTWILPIGLALPAPMSSNPNMRSNPTLMNFYFAVSALLVLGLLLTRRDFFSKQ